MAEMPLSGIRVLDLSRVLAGPFAGQLLADLGAEVIKVERPGKGDDARMFGPPFLQDREGKPRVGEAPMYISVNRSKRSVTVNIARPEGQDIVRRLAAISDVLLENYKVGDLKRYGLDYESIRSFKPGIVYCSVTGYGQSGPYSHRPGYDSIFQAMGGLMSVTGLPDGVPGGGPMKAGPSLVDAITGLYASNAILGALYHRDRNGGRGQYIDVALLDAVIAAQTHYTSSYLVSGVAPGRRGTEGNGGMPSQMFAVANGSVMINCGNDGQYARLVTALGRPDLIHDPRFDTNPRRNSNRDLMTPILSGILKDWKLEDVLKTLDKAQVPAGPINDFKAVFDDPHIRHRRMQVEVPHPVSGTVKLAANPIRYSATPIENYTAPPLLGQHTDEVLGNLLGMDEKELARLREGGVI